MIPPTKALFGLNKMIYERTNTFEAFLPKLDLPWPSRTESTLAISSIKLLALFNVVLYAACFVANAASNTETELNN